MKYVLISILGVFLVYSTVTRSAAVESFEFQGETYILSDEMTRSGSDVYVYTPGGQHAMRTKKYISITHPTLNDIPTAEFTKLYMERIEKMTKGFVKVNEKSFFYVEADHLVHNILSDNGDGITLTSYAVAIPDQDSKNPSDYSPDRAIAWNLESTVSNLPLPPRKISTWF